MKIVYFANFGNKGSDDTESHIAHSLSKLGHQVFKIPESSPEFIPKGADLFLFHKGGPFINEALRKVDCPKVFWYFDKVWNDRPAWFDRILPQVDLGFLTDGDYLEASQNDKLVLLRQGIGGSVQSFGMPIGKRYEGKIAFTGSNYKGREEFINLLQKEFGNDFKIYNDAFNRDLFDLCAAIPILVAPPFPSTDRYWSSRIYMVLGSGGFLVHPILQGLVDDGLESGVHYAGYSTPAEMVAAIRYYLIHPKEREKIMKTGYTYVTSNLTYTNRCQKLLEVIHQRLSIGTAE